MANPECAWWHVKPHVKPRAMPHAQNSRLVHISTIYEETHMGSRPLSGSSPKCRTLKSLTRLRIKSMNPINRMSLCHTPHHPHLSNTLPPRTTLCSWPKRTGQRTHNSSTPCGVGNGHYSLKTALSRPSFKTRSRLYFATLSPSIRSPPGRTKPSLFETPSTKLLRLRVSTTSLTASPRTATSGGGSHPLCVLPSLFPFPPLFSPP